MIKFKGFKKQIKAVEKAISRKEKRDIKSVTKLKKQVLQEQLKQLKAGKIRKEIEVRKSILAKRSGFFKGSEEDTEVPRKQMVFMGRA